MAAFHIACLVIDDSLLKFPLQNCGQTLLTYSFLNASCNPFRAASRAAAEAPPMALAAL